MDIRKILVIVKNDFKSSTIITVLLFLITSILLLITIYNSKTLQLLSFMIYTDKENVSFYHLLAEPFLKYLVPIIIAQIINDTVSKDIRTGRIRLILSRTKRLEYYFGKYLSSVTIGACLFALLLIFVNLYSYFSIGLFLFAYSGNLLLSSLIVSLFYISVMLLISICSKKPMQYIMLFYMVSFLLSFFPVTSKFGFFTHVVSGKIQITAILLVLSASIIVTMTSIYLFNERNI